MQLKTRCWGTALCLGVLAGLLFSLQVVALSAQAARARPDQNPAQVYRSACMNCHGPDGKGVAQSTLGFALGVPDFTDCSFATREPDSDWLAVITDGGPARGFARMLPAFHDALTAEEIEKALEHVRGFCPNDAWPRGDLNLPRALVTEKAFPEDEAVITSAITPEGGASVASKIVYEKRIGPRNQVEIVLPYGFKDSQPDGWVNGIGDLGLGFKRVLHDNTRTGTIVSVTGEAVLPTGDEKDGVGKGYAVLEPFLTFGQVLPGDAFVQFQGGIEIPTNSELAAKEAFWRTTLGRSIVQGAFGRTWSPMVEVIGSREIEDGQKVHWDLLPQMQVTLNTRQHIMANVGVRLPVNQRTGRHAQLLFYVLWDWFDGGLFEGW
ncbi:MAG: cytochrome c [Acidobacteria bacterium]|nr:MAG: cytochrome c [Acidobacteriota bacterium]